MWYHNAHITLHQLIKQLHSLTRLVLRVEESDVIVYDCFREEGGGVEEEEGWRKRRGGGRVEEEEGWRKRRGGGRVEEEEGWRKRRGGGRGGVEEGLRKRRG